MKKTALALAAAPLLLAGCATTENKIPQEVLIPVAAQCPAPTLPARPRLAVTDLAENATPQEVARATAESLKAATGYALALEQLLDAYTDNNNKKDSNQ